MSRVIILPVITVIAIVLKGLFGIEISEDLQNGIVDGILAVFLVGTGVLTAIRTRQKREQTGKI